MLNYFYKTFLVSILSGCLLMMSFTYQNGNFNFKSNSVQAAEASQLQTEGLKTTDYMATLTMLAAALVVTRLIKCKWTLDVWAAIIAAGVFFAGEILAAIKSKELMEDQTREVKRNADGTVEENQIKDLEILKKSYKDAKDIAEAKKILQEVAAAAFGIAAIAAGVMYGEELAGVTACTTALTTAAAACTAACTVACGAIPVAVVTCEPATPTVCAGGILEFANIPLPAAAQALSSALVGPSVAKASVQTTATTTLSTAQTSAAVCPITLAANAACTVAMPALHVLTRVVCVVPPVAVIPGLMENQLYASSILNYTPIKQPSRLSNFFNNMMMSEAKADFFSPLGIGAAILIAFILAVSTTLGATIDNFLYSPLHRAIAWGVFAGLGVLAFQATQEQIDKIQRNIDAIDEILKPLQVLPDGIQQAAPPNTNIQTLAGVTNTMGSTDTSAIDLGNNGATIPCFTGSSSSTNCPNLSNELKDLPAMGMMPEFVQTQMGSLTKVADGLNGKNKISSATMNGAGAFAKGSKAIRDQLKKQRAMLQSKLKDLGSKINLDDESKKFEASLRGTIQKELDKRHTSAGALLASIGGGAGQGKDKADKKATMPKYTPPAITPIAIPGADAYGDSRNGKTKEEAVVAPAVVEKKAQSLDDFEVKNNDITSDKDTSIFDVISNRYNKSYDKLFKKVK